MIEAADKIFDLGLVQKENLEISSELSALIEQRRQARRNKDFPLSDKLRQELEARGIIVEDTKEGQKWRRK